MKEKGKKNPKNNRDRKTQMSGSSYSESVRDKWFCCAFKLGFVQLICKASLIFKSNLFMRLVTLFDMFLNPRFKMTTRFANIARTTANTSESIY